MKMAADDPNYPTYAEHRFTPTEWQGVQVSGPAAATVTVLGYDSWRNPGETAFQSDPILQWQLVLAHEAGRWKLVDVAAFDPNERDARDGDEQFPDGMSRLP